MDTNQYLMDPDLYFMDPDPYFMDPNQYFMDPDQYFMDPNFMDPQHCNFVSNFMQIYSIKNEIRAGVGDILLINWTFSNIKQLLWVYSSCISYQGLFMMLESYHRFHARKFNHENDQTTLKWI